MRSTSCAGSLCVCRFELDLDEPADPCLGDVEAEVPERAAHGLSLRVENARLRPDRDGRLHRSTISGSAR